MPQPILYAAVTNHGFGHSTRTASLLAEVKRLCPDILLIFATTAPRWLLESYLREEFIHRPQPLDIGVVQQDSLSMNQAATLEKLRQIRAQERVTIAGEVNFIRQNRVSLVLADIPPIATAIARSAGVPCWMSSNFGWDFIYRDWGGEFVEMADWIAERFSECDRLFRLPFHEPMSAFPNITDVGLTGGSPDYAESEIRSQFNLTTPVERTVLLTFGGLGIEQIPYQNLQRYPDWQFITFDQQAPDLPNLLKIKQSSNQLLNPQKLRPVDFMPLCKCVISKPGYSTFAEACRLDVPIISITRDNFAEAPILLAGIQDYHPHRILSPTEFFQGDWQFIQEPVNPPRRSESIGKNGNTEIAKAIVEYLHTH